MKGAPGGSFNERAKEVARVGGWAALAIAVLTAATANAAAQALVVGLAGGQPELGMDGIQTIVNAFVLTAPLAIAVTIIGFAFARVDVRDDQWQQALIYVAIAIGVGLILGNLLYQMLFSVTLTVDLYGLTQTVQRQSGPWYAKLGAGIVWFLIGYYQLFGAGHFAAAFIAGGFGAYAAHKLLPSGGPS
jgi:hypothetical protein